MYNKSNIIEIIFQSIDEINQQENFNILKNPQTPLFGRGSDLDSLGLVNLIVLVEEKINDKFNVAISLVNENAMSQKNSPFTNVDALTNYVLQLLMEIK